MIHGENYMKLKIDKNSKFSIELDHTFESYDGHCLRAYSYYKEQMPEIHLAEEGTKVYKVTTDDGEIKYCTEGELRSL